MKSRIKKMWLKALRSGKYAQCEGQLVDESNPKTTKFCCLGVLTNLYVEETGDAEAWKSKYADDDPDTATVLDEAVVVWAGLPDENPDVKGISDKNGYAYDTLAEMNDSGHSFKEIADIIEKQF